MPMKLSARTISVMAVVAAVGALAAFTTPATAQESTQYPDCSTPGELKTTVAKQGSYPVVIRGCYIATSDTPVAQIAAIIGNTDNPRGTPKTSWYSTAIGGSDAEIGCNGVQGDSDSIRCDGSVLEIKTAQKNGQTVFDLRIQDGKRPTDKTDVTLTVALAALSEPATGGYAGVVSRDVMEFFCTGDAKAAAGDDGVCLVNTDADTGRPKQFCFDEGDTAEEATQDLKTTNDGGNALNPGLYSCSAGASSVAFHEDIRIGRYEASASAGWVKACTSGAVASGITAPQDISGDGFKSCVSDLAGKCVGSGASGFGPESQFSCGAVMPPLCDVYGMEWGGSSCTRPGIDQ